MLRGAHSVKRWPKLKLVLAEFLLAMRATILPLCQGSEQHLSMALKTIFVAKSFGRMCLASHSVLARKICTNVHVPRSLAKRRPTTGLRKVLPVGLVEYRIRQLIISNISL